MSKEHSYAYEAGYRDGAINYELDHCPACKNVADLQEVLDENAKLRELLSEAREELADMYDYMDGGYAWPRIGEDPSFGPFYKRLCSVLGVEVEE